MKRSVRCFLFLAISFFTIGFQSCYTYRVQAPGQVPVADSSAVVWSFAWGLAQQQPQATNCNGQSFAEVTVESNLGFDILTVVSLGLVSPKIVKWYCAAPVITGDGSVETANRDGGDDGSQP